MNSENWQTLFSSVKQRTEYAFKNGLFCDVSFTVNSSNGGQKTLQANKYMLAISSPVFEAMFYGALAENNSTIHLPDCTKEGFQQMLQFIHSDQVQLSGSNVMEMLYVADKYIIPSLAQKCKEYLQKKLAPEEVFIILPQKMCYEDEELKQHCWDLVDAETKRAVFSESFLNLSQEMMLQVLQRDTLKIKELDLFKAVDKWASNKVEEKGIANNGKNKRDVLGEDVIKLIRFPVMKVKEFAEFVLPCDVLNNQEVTEVFHNAYSISKSTSWFSSKPRDATFTSDCRFGHIIPPANESCVKECNNAIRFKTDKSVFLIGVRMFGCSGREFKLRLGITKGHIIGTLFSVESLFVTENELTDDTYHGFTVALDEPLKLDKNVWYKLSATIYGPPTYSGKDGKAELTVEDPYGDNFQITYKSDSDWFRHTSINHGQFPAFVFQNIED